MVEPLNELEPPSSTPPPLNIQEITSTRELESLNGQWQDLVERCPWATPFQSPDWLIPWWHHFGNGNLQSIAFYEDQGRLAGFAPLFLHENELLFVGTGISDYLDLICEPESADVVAQLLLEHLRDAAGGYGRCNLQELRQASPLVRSALKHTGSVLSPVGTCPVVPLPSTPETYMSSLPAKLRRSLRQTAKGLAPIAIEEAGKKEEIHEYLEMLFLLHRKRWEARNMTGVLESPHIQSFHHEAAELFGARGALGLYRLRHEENIAAVVYGFRKDRRFYAYLSGFDPELDELSPGAFLIHAVIEESIRSEYREFDFLRGAEKYKYLWGAKDTTNYQLTLPASKQL